MASARKSRGETELSTSLRFAEILAPLQIAGYPERFRKALMFALAPPKLLPIILLFASNIFMTFAWYGHLKYKSSPLILAILVSWGIALAEYCFAVPANRFGSAVYSTAQLKTMQEVITLTVFAGFSVFYLGEPFRWNYALGFAMIAGGAYFIFEKW
jgi:uncharacterized protein (DUF486 family)